MILNFNEEEVDSIISEVIEQFMPLSNHMKGLCVIKKVIQKTTNQEKIRTILDIITENAMNLVQNPYGNYAIQTALEVNFICKF